MDLEILKSLTAVEGTVGDLGHTLAEHHLTESGTILEYVRAHVGYGVGYLDLSYRRATLKRAILKSGNSLTYNYLLCSAAACKCRCTNSFNGVVDVNARKCRAALKCSLAYLLETLTYIEVSKGYATRESVATKRINRVGDLYLLELFAVCESVVSNVGYRFGDNCHFYVST